MRPSDPAALFCCCCCSSSSTTVPPDPRRDQSRIAITIATATQRARFTSIRRRSRHPSPPTSLSSSLLSRAFQRLSSFDTNPGANGFVILQR